MPITRDQCLKLAEEVYGQTYWSDAMSWRLEALCQKVWQEAQNESLAGRAQLMATIEDQRQQIDRLTIALQAPYDLQAIPSTDAGDMTRLF